MSITDENVAIIATRAEWAALLLDLQASSGVKSILDENPETMTAAMAFASDSGSIIDAIAISVVDTQLRTERNAVPNLIGVKVLKSKMALRFAGESRT